MSLLTLLRRRGTIAAPPPSGGGQTLGPSRPVSTGAGFDATPVIRILPLDGSWETLGVDRLRGLSAENIVASSNDWGPDALSFRLASESGGLRPDLLPYTPVEFELGLLVWSGFVWQRPSEKNAYQVVCRGWQYHLDDNLYDRAYVHTRLADYVDGRSFLSTDLVHRTASWSITNGEGQIVLALPEGAIATNTTSCSVVLDLGPDSTAKRVIVAATGGGAPAGWNFHIRGATSYPTASEENTNTSGLPASLATYTITFATPRRYVELLLANSTGVTGNGAASTYVAIKSVQVFRDTAYESGNASILKADTVVRDALTLAPLLNQSLFLQNSGTFSIPSYATGGYVTPRSIMEAVNLLENYLLKIGGEDQRSLVYRPKLAYPIAEVGDWSGSEFSDSTVSGEEIYDTAIVDASGPDAARLVSKRIQTGTLVDRRGFHRARRIDVSSAVTQAVADRIADLWLTEHRTAPFSGTLRIVGTGARRPQSGTSIPPQEFLLYSGEKIRLANRIDPDTGSWGREGRIAGVSYRHDDRAVEIAIDDQRKKFETILSRYAVLVGG